MKRTLLTLSVTLLSLCTYAQKETYTWFFGKNNGLDFKNTQTINHPTFGTITGLPTHIAGPISTYEGCFAMSDRDGNFLFASDGITVYNKTKAKMLPVDHKLLGHPSATQSGIVVPMPESTTKYYIITSSCEEQRRPGVAAPFPGQNYSIVDMSLDGNKGSLTIMNQPLSIKGLGYTIEDTPENLTVVGHSNGIDYWLVNRMRDLFVVWAVTKDGISDPVGYRTGYDLGDHRLHDFTPGVANPKDYRASGMGVIKFAPDGKTVAHADYCAGTLSLGQFDPTTGVISDIKVVQNTGIDRIYGIEYSPNGKYIYLASIQTAKNPSHKGLYVVETSKIMQPPYKKLDDNVSNLQLGSMNRIFGISEHWKEGEDKYLWVILDPDEGGTKLAKLPNILPAATGARLGLPPFITTYFRLEGVYKSTDYPCINREYEYEAYLFQPVGLGPIAYLEWDFGDGLEKIRQNYVVGQNSYRTPHTYRKIGEHTITVTPHLANGTAMAKPILKTKITVRYCNLIINSATTDSLN